MLPGAFTRFRAEFRLPLLAILWLSCQIPIFKALLTIIKRKTTEYRVRLAKFRATLY
jgi:hypothetical protein